MKKIFAIMLTFCSLFLFVSCDKKNEDSSNDDNIVDSGSTENNNNNENNNSNDNSNDNQNDNNGSTDQTPPPVVDDKDAETTIYLAGDSTVKTYADDQYIAGWGQYLDAFLTDNVTVVNCAQGGRSSRSFINEGRLYDIEGCEYTFSENGGNSIGDVIKAGDYLFIQFGHNDDDTKRASSYTTIYDRMIPLGEPDANGIFPTTEGEKMSNDHLPEEYTSKAKADEITKALETTAKYGDTYYSYDCGGTYKWFLKQYIDFAREKGAIPVLITPVARVKFSGNKIIGGAGLHGKNFEYVEAVRQLALEEDCILIDLFAQTKDLLECATSSYSDFLMALKPNELRGSWPTGFDSAYKNPSLGYTGIEATHYNKYGAYLTAACVAEEILFSISRGEKHNNKTEAFLFKKSVLTTPERYIEPSNNISKAKINSLENSIQKVKVTNPSRVYTEPSAIIALIDELAKITVTNDNYLDVEKQCQDIRSKYITVNVDDKSSITNIDKLKEYEDLVEDFIIANRPVPIKTVVMNPSTLATANNTSSISCGEFQLVCSSDKPISVLSGNANFSINGVDYSVTKYLNMGGSAAYGNGRYLSFTTTGKCSISVVAKSTGDTVRTVGLFKNTDTKTSISGFEAGTSITSTTYEIAEAGTYYLGSTGSNVYIYYILIEYFE